MSVAADLTVHVGPTVTTPLDADLVRLVEEVAVTVAAEGRSGFSLTMATGRDRGSGSGGYAPLLSRTFKVGNRVQLTATLGSRAHVLMDGIVTTHQLTPAAEPGGTRLTITGEDLSVLLDLVELSLPFPAMPDFVIAGLLMAPLTSHGVVPVAIPEPAVLVPLPTREVKHKKGTNHAILTEMAREWGYHFYVTPGPTRGMSTAYWGPQVRVGVPQKALTWQMGAASNLGNVQLGHDGTKGTQVYGLVKEQLSGAPVPIVGLPFAAPPVAAEPAWVSDAPFLRVKRLEDDEAGNVVKALWDATSTVVSSQRAVATASGELDVGRYGDVLAARQLVDLRGVGDTMHGTWFVASVTHAIGRGRWTQQFQLEREGTRALTSAVARP